MRLIGFITRRQEIPASVIVFWIILLILLFAACSISSLQTELFYTFSPEKAVTHQVLSRSKNIEAFDLLGTQNTPDGKMGSVYTYSHSGGYVVGYAVSEKVDPFQWRVVSSNDYESPSMPKKSMPVDYQVYQDGYTALFGPVFSKDVVSVEANFSDGEAVLDQVAGGYFLIYSSRPTDVCAMKVVGNGDQVLFQKTFSNRYVESDECP
jgi:hypothetical protein